MWFSMIANVIVAPSVTIYKIFVIKIVRHWPWPLEWAKVKCKNANRKSTHDFLYDCNSNIGNINHHLRDVRNKNVHDLDLDFRNGPRSNANISIESRPDLTTYLMTIVLFLLSLVIYETFAYQIKFQKFDVEIEDQGQGGVKQDLRHSAGNVQFYIGDFVKKTYPAIYVYARDNTQTDTARYRDAYSAKSAKQICLKSLEYVINIKTQK